MQPIIFLINGRGMKLINKTDPRFADSVVRGGRFFFYKRHQADDSSVIHGVNKIYNSPLSLSKSISCPSPSNAYPCINRPKKGISSFSPMHNSTDPINLSPYHEVITTTSTLFYNDLADDYALDAKNYFYLGSFETCSVLHQGITLDEFGNLLLVKGKSKGLLKYLWKKVRGKLRFYWARIILKDFPQLTFDRILVNGQGQLVAKVKGCNQYYSVSLSTKNIVKHFDIDEVNDMSSSISLCLRKTEPIREHPNGLLVRHDGYRSVLLKSQEGSLFLEQQEHKPSDRGHQVNLTQPKRLALPLSADSQVDSVCGEFDVFKIVVIHGFHKRVYYINPRDIDIHLAKVKKISHKPPQAFVTAMGGDPYEKVYSGLPFDCGRLGNFSSRHLPLISVPVDKFRQKAKAAKKHYYVGNTRQGAVKWIQAIDPGIPFLAKTIRRAVKKKPVSSMRDISRCFKDEIGDMRCVGLSHGMDRVYDSVSGDLDVRWLIKEKIKDTIFSLEPKDSISLCDIFEASFFFGIAAAGIPFMPGWFGGILYRVQKGAKVVFTKLENGNIKLIYEKDHAKSWIGLLGTGQGLEDHCKLITINDVDLDRE